MAYTIEFRQEMAQPTLSIRDKVTFTDLGMKVGQFVGDVINHLKKLGIQPVGPPFTRVHGFAVDHVDLEAGLPIGQTVPGQDAIQSGSLPAGPVATTLHCGDYATLPEASEALRAWAEKDGWSANGPNWERHLVAPGHDPNPENWRTEIVMPLTKD